MTQDDIQEAAITILKRRRDRYLRQAAEAKLHAVYAHGTHNPREDATPAELAVEQTLRDSITAEALFYSQEAGRFAAAVIAAGGAE